MARRSGVTLVEVLVAIFVMGIGLIALLTLFPIGILRMGRALLDERSAQAARNADAVAIFQNLRNDASVVTAAIPPYDGAATNNDVFVNPYPANAATKPADPYGESFPIFVDPIGYYNVGAGAPREWVHGIPGVLRRRPVSFVTNITSGNAALRNAATQALYANFTLWDDMAFEGAFLGAGVTPLPGTPETAAGTVLRNPRFSWGYTMRRPMASDKTVIDCSIVVFDGRSLSTSQNGSLPEHVYQSANDPNLLFAAQTVYFTPANSTITIDYTNAPLQIGPPVRPGDWIMDVTYVPSATGTNGSRHAYWYRVVAAEDLVVAGALLARYEVQQPIRGFPLAPPVGSTDPWGNLSHHGSAVFLENVAAVFEKGPARLP